MNIQGQYEIKCYKIWWEDTPEDFYIGSTAYDALYKRMKCHRKDAKAGKTAKIQQTIREKGYDFKYGLIASCMVSCKDEQRLFEQQWIDKLKPSLNSYRAHTTIEQVKQYQKEYREKPEVKEYHKEYYNKPERKEYVKKYNQRPEVKEYQKKYKQRPEVKQRRKECRQKPEVKQKNKEYNQKPEIKQKRKEYNQKPEVKQRMKEYIESKKRTCICGSVYVDIQSPANRHYNTQKHIDWVENFYNRIRALPY
jgi:hypothetical protein